jgi:hypothetical protein
VTGADMEAEIENIFLTYANYPLRENPDKLFKILEKLKNLKFFYFFEGAWPSYQEIIRHFIMLVKTDDQKRAEKIYKYKSSNFKIAFEAIYGYRDGFCEKRCPKRWRKSIFGSERFVGPGRLKCYECDRLYFRYLLTGIARRKEYSEIGPDDFPLLGLVEYLMNAHRNIEKFVEPVTTSKESGFEEGLTERFTLIPRNLKSNHGSYRENFSSIFFDSSVAFSLAEFLLHKDRRRLKYCDECEKFFVSKSIRPSRFCSDKCRLAWHNLKRIESGEAREYKRKKRAEGAKESYYG